MTELKPCPFCGGRAHIEDNPLGTDNEGGNIRGGVGLGWLWTVECGECGANAGLRQDVAVAAEAWNRRAALSEADFAAAVHDGSLWRKERTCRLGRMPYEPGCYEGLRCSVCHTVDLDMGEGPYCSGCGARIERGDEG